MNDHAAKELVARHPARLRAFAAVPLQDPEKAADELERAIRNLGFVGALINGYSNIGDEDNAQYLDEPQVEPFWDRVDKLGSARCTCTRGFRYPASSGSTGATRGCWGRPGIRCRDRHPRAATDLSGLFDRHPRVSVILGHLGEGLPFTLPRVEHRLRHQRRETHGAHEKAPPSTSGTTST